MGLFVDWVIDGLWDCLMEYLFGCLFVGSFTDCLMDYLFVCLFVGSFTHVV